MDIRRMEPDESELVALPKDMCQKCLGSGIGVKPDPYICPGCGGLGFIEEEDQKSEG
jgi:DnaJ-class molecular chaperone